MTCWYCGGDGVYANCPACIAQTLSVDQAPAESLPRPAKPRPRWGSYRVRVDWSESDGAYVATCPELPGVQAANARAGRALVEFGKAVERVLASDASA
ncbi:MAG: type II toxin-antitoxin system HicB family antitoxin [Gemmatimonadaceae bacterium]